MRNSKIGQSYYEQKFPNNIDRRSSNKPSGPQRDYTKFLIIISILFILGCILIYFMKQ